MLGLDVAIASPLAYTMPDADVARLRKAGVEPILTEDVAEAVDGADVVYTDAWYSMGQEAEAAERRPVFRPFQVNAQLMARAGPGAVFLHCLPAHRGDEVTDAVMDGTQSRVWDQAENRVYTEQALLYALISGDHRGERLG